MNSKIKTKNFVYKDLRNNVTTEIAIISSMFVYSIENVSFNSLHSL